MRMKSIGAALILGAALVSAQTAAVEVEELPFRVKKLSDRIARFQAGRYATQSCLTVVKTDQGLIVIDTGLTSSFAGQMKRKFREVLGRDDVRYVINTHSHWDHTGGNQVFPEAEIVGHENIGPTLKRFVERKSRFLAERREYASRLEKELAAKGPDSSEGPLISERLEQEKLFIKELETTYVATPPTKAFSDRLTLRLADLTVKMFSYSDCFVPGPSRHTDNDILIQIPELGLLLTGDALFFYEKSLAPIPPPDDWARWLGLMDEILVEPVTIVSDGHANPLLGGGEMLKALYRYTKELFEAAIRAKRDGTDLTTFQGQNTLDRKFAYLRKFYDLDAAAIQEGHRANVERFLRQAGKNENDLSSKEFLIK